MLILSDRASRKQDMALTYITFCCKESASRHQVRITSELLPGRSLLPEFPAKHLSDYLRTIWGDLFYHMVLVPYLWWHQAF